MDIYEVGPFFLFIFYSIIGLIVIYVLAILICFPFWVYYLFHEYRSEEDRGNVVVMIILLPLTITFAIMSSTIAPLYFLHLLRVRKVMKRYEIEGVDMLISYSENLARSELLSEIEKLPENKLQILVDQAAEFRFRQKALEYVTDVNFLQDQLENNLNFNGRKLITRYIELSNNLQPLVQAFANTSEPFMRLFLLEFTDDVGILKQYQNVLLEDYEIRMDVNPDRQEITREEELFQMVEDKINRL